MIETALLAAFLAAPDTTLDLRRGDQVIVERFNGDLVVTGGAGNRLVLDSDDDDAISVRRDGSSVVIRPSRSRRSGSLDAVLQLPEWVDLEVGGIDLDIRVSGFTSRVRVTNVEGDIELLDITGGVAVASVEGEVTIESVSGGVTVAVQADDITLADVSGPISVSTNDGDLMLVDVESDEVRANTQDGDVDFVGSILDGGDYRFFVHSGDVTLAVSPDVSARFAVSTFDGDFESAFPVRVQRFTTGREFEFVLGDGSARVEIEVFDGEIRLLQR